MRTHSNIIYEVWVGYLCILFIIVVVVDVDDFSSVFVCAGVGGEHHIILCGPLSRAKC